MCHHQLTLWNADTVVCQIIETIAPQHAADLYFCFQCDSQIFVIGDFCIWSSNFGLWSHASWKCKPFSFLNSSTHPLSWQVQKVEIYKSVHINLKPQHQKEALSDHLIWNLPTSAPPGRNPLPSSCSNGFSDKRSTTSSTTAASSAQWTPQ